MNVDTPQAFDTPRAYERAIQPLAVGRRNWLFVGDDNSLSPAAIVLSVVASAKRHGRNAWEYVRGLLTLLPARPPDADVADFFPDRWRPL